jgi:anti-sigma factor RsiW
MSNLGMRHPTDEQLLRFADGELSAPEAEEVRGHLRACWQCRTELEEIERTIGECVRYRKIVFETCLPPAPSKWFDIYRHFAGIDESQRRRRWANRASEPLGAALRNWRLWAPAFVTVVLIAVVVQRFRQTPSVSAAELLHKAMAAAESRSRTPRRIQIRTRTHRLTRVVGSARTAGMTGAGPDSLARIESMFRAAHYNWEDPLSAKSYAEWRNQLADKRDEVTSERDRYQLRTTTSSGELVEATLQLSLQDLHAVEGTLQFRNREWVEITELPNVPTLPPPVPAEVADAAPASSPSPSKPDLPAARVATPGDELKVLAALHDLGADLGDPIEVMPSGGEILVTGTGIAPERQREIRDGLSAIPRVTVRFPEPSTEAVGPEGRIPRSISVSPGTSRLQAELEKQLGGRAALEQFADHVLEVTEAMMSRAHALRRLAQRFSPEREAQMFPQQRQLLKRLRQEHAEALLQNVIDIQSRVQPVLAALGASAGVSQAPIISVPWQDATEQLFAEGRHNETLLVGILGVPGGQIQSQELPAQVVASLAQLRNRAENYERLTTGR